MKCGQVTERFYYGSISLSCLLSSQGSQIFRDFTNAPSHPLSAYILTLHLSMPAYVRSQILHRSGLPALPPFSLKEYVSPPVAEAGRCLDRGVQNTWTANCNTNTTNAYANGNGDHGYDDGAGQKWRRTPFEEETEEGWME
jgi:hypothetical protein